MNAPTVNTLVDLLIDLDRAGVQELVAADGRLLYRPRSAVTPDLAERLRTHKAALLAALGPAAPADGPVHEDAAGGFAEDDSDPAPIGWDSAIDPPEPCGKCGGLVFWWSIRGDRRCVACDPPLAAVRLLERAETIRRRHGIPSPAGAAEMLVEMKTNRGT
jgi:hypothetical protein